MHVAPDPSLQPELDLGGHDGVGGFFGDPRWQVNDEAGLVGDLDVRAVVAADDERRHPSTEGDFRTGHEAGHGGAVGGDLLQLAHGIEQPLTLAVEEAFNGRVVVGRQGEHLNAARRDRDPPLRRRGSSTKFVGDLGLADANAGHQCGAA